MTLPSSILILYKMRSLVPFLVGLGIVIVVLLAPVTILAQRTKVAPSPTPSPVIEINSYQAFWPLTAGKTQDDQLYFLKKFKEEIRGWFIFGTAQKAEYTVFLATKRILEVEKLIKEGKSEIADKTLEEALKQSTKAEILVNSALEKGENLGSSRQVMIDRLTNIIKLATWLGTQSEKNSDKLHQVQSKTTSLLDRLQGS